MHPESGASGVQSLVAALSCVILWHPTRVPENGVLTGDVARELAHPRLMAGKPPA